MSFNNPLGQAARLDDFYYRPHVCDAFIEKLDSGSHILLSAPRRNGKTSQMFHLYDNPPSGFLVQYEITQSINSENDFFKRLYKRLTKTLKPHKKLWQQATTFIGQKEVTELSTKGVKLQKNQIDYYDKLLDLLENLDLGDNRLIFMVDEFADTLNNIIRKEGEDAGIRFLQRNHELRQQPDLYKKVQFIYAGSIGLENIVAMLNCMDTINDPYTFVIPTLSPTEQIDFMKRLFEDSGIQVGDTERNYCIEKMGWHIPYYYQLIFDRIKSIDFGEAALHDTKLLTTDIIDLAFEKALTERSYFEHWQKRLKQAFKGKQLKFLEAVLIECAQNGEISFASISNIAARPKLKMENQVMDLLNVLEHDGYLSPNKDKSIYLFNSPLLRQWWKLNMKKA